MNVFIPPKLNYLILTNQNKNQENYLITYNKHWLKVLILKNIKIKKYSFIFNEIKDKNLDTFKNFFSTWYLLSSKKIKFSGKGYKIIKKGSCFNLSLNTSHSQWALMFKTLPIKIQKQRYLLLNNNGYELNAITEKIIKSRFVNIYTKRGLRLGKQQIMKKIGKRSV